MDFDGGEGGGRGGGGREGVEIIKEDVDRCRAPPWHRQRQ